MSLIILLQTGCWDQKLFEEIGFVLQIGIERDKSNNLLLSMAMPVVTPEAKKETEFQFSSKERLVRAFRERVWHVSGKLIQGGKIQQICFSKDLAKEGINDYLEIFMRNPDNPLLANIVVIDGSPKKMMEVGLDYKDKPRISIYAANLLRIDRRRSYAPEVRLFDFIIRFNSKTLDPVTPIMKYDEKNLIVSGSALFCGDKMVGEIDTAGTALLNILMGESRPFEYMYEEKNLKDEQDDIKRGAAVTVIKAKRKLKINWRDDKPVINVGLNITAQLDEYSENKQLYVTENKKKLEGILAASMKEQITELLGYMKDIGSDPVGFGEMVRSGQNSRWRKIVWKDVYKDASFNVDVKLNIESYGTIW